jgi:carboxylesterase type B
MVVAGALAGAAYAATTLTLAASPSTVVYGKAVALSGALSTKRANQQITVQAQECGKPTFVKAGNTKTVANGAYSVAVTPAVNTVYQAKWKSTLSPKVTVSVKPLLKLTRVARGSYKAQVTAGLDLKGKTVLFQRYSRLKKRWVQIKKVTLSTSTPGTKPTVVASASFKSKVRRGTRVRVYLSKAQAAPCFVKAASNAVRA